MKALLLPAAVLILLVLLYNCGFISVKNARSWFFVGSIYSASYKGCHGKVYRIVRPSESRVYLLCFSSQLNNGSVEAELLDKDKNVLISLKGHENKELFLEQGKKYYLVLRFRSADGAHHFEIR